MGLEHLTPGFPALAGRGKESEVRSSKTSFRKGDVLFGKLRPYLRKSALAEEEGICSTDILVFRSKRECLPGFLCFLTHTDQFVSHAKATTSGVQHPRTSWSSLRGFSLQLPPLIEQQKIAAVLGLVQRAVEQQERLITLTTELKKNLLHKLFTEGLRGEPQKQTEIGPVPESWTATTLGELACKPHGFLQTGPFGSQLHKDEYVTEGVGVVNPTHLWGNRINREDVPRVSPETAARLDRHLLEAGDILFARRGEIGRHGMVTKEEEGWLCGTGCFLSRVRQELIDNRFLSYLFSTRGAIAWLNSHAAGAIMPNLSNTVLRSMPVFFPSKEVQTEIADSIDAAEQKIAIHQRKHAALTDLFRTLLHQLMTAQMRVHALDLSEMEKTGIVQ
ncbi:MAG: restriction endonuclease subunit S [Desulfobacterales bacterium]|nr:restriction endonuclease subunit S [Desulfobacterales bacterium]